MLYILNIPQYFRVISFYYRLDQGSWGPAIDKAGKMGRLLVAFMRVEDYDKPECLFGNSECNKDVTSL